MKISPIIEYYYIYGGDSKRKANYVLLDESVKFQSELKLTLCNAGGVYIFYDSMGRAVYVGKGKSGRLYSEMISAYNRNRGDHQRLWKVKHIWQNRKFDAEKESARPIQPMPFVLYDVAHYFSAYRVEDEYVETIEALLIRAFANQLTNKKKEKFRLHEL